MISQFLEAHRSSKAKILVIGDCMIDEYHTVNVNRISPEIPDAIISSPTMKCTRLPGGAANVCYQLRNFPNLEVHLASIMSPADHTFFQNCGIKVHGTVMDNVQIPVKKRFVADGFQIKRWDIESPKFGLSDSDFDACYNQFINSLHTYKDFDVVVFSDYNKGMFPDNAIPKLFQNTITIVDPKKAPLNKWFGCSVIKANAKESVELTGKTDVTQQLMEIKKQTNCKTVITTLGSEGYIGLHESYIFKSPPIEKVQVESVIGAGDCFIAILASSMAMGFKIEDAAQIACKAGSIYVQKRLNRPIVPAELIENKIVNANDLKIRDFTLAFTNGCFDILHVGHLETLKWAATQADKLVVALNSDESVRKLKGEGRPVIPLDQRLQMISALECVDFVVSFEEETPIEVIKMCKPDVVCKGKDYSDKTVVGSDITKTSCAPTFVNGVSTTSIISSIK